MSGNLTRCNRAGLSRFRYVDGNAATYLDTVIGALKEKFPQWKATQEHRPIDIPDDAGEEIREELRRKELARVTGQYHIRTSDWAWEIARTFARACHILTEYIDAYANESYLGTATQWDNVRKMVGMLGYHPAPPSSASTYLVIEAKAGERGPVKKGFRVSHSPPEGGDAVVFETLEDIEVSPELNELCLIGWNVSDEPLEDDDSARSNTLTLQWVEESGRDMKSMGLSAGQVAILEHTGPEGSSRVCVTIEGISDIQKGEISIKTFNIGTIDHKWKKGYVRLWAMPRDVRRDRLNGEYVMYFDSPHGLTAGDVIAWKTRHGLRCNRWYFSRVVEAEGNAVRLPGTPPDVGTTIYVASKQGRTDGLVRVPLKGTKSAPLVISVRSQGIENEPQMVAYDSERKMISENNTGNKAVERRVTDDNVKEIYLVFPWSRTLTRGKGPDKGFWFDGSPEGLAGGMLMVGECSSNNHEALTIESITKKEDGFSLIFKEKLDDLRRLYGPFRYVLRPRGFDRSGAAAVSDGLLELEADNLEHDVGALAKGRTVMLERDDGEAHLATIIDVLNDNGGIVSIRVFPLPGDEYRKGNTVIRANVVKAGHGERRHAGVLGSGEATLSHQSMVLEVPDVSFVADPSMPAGVRADMDVTVEDRIWNQVSTLRDSGPASQHYCVTMTEEGYLRVTFGDGTHGRRLPTEINNVRISYRQGTGLRGNLPPGCLEEPVNPSPFVGSVRQPLSATGGGDMEDAASMRKNAPATVLTIERAVSVADFASLAMGRPDVWQAIASEKYTGSQSARLIEVVVVPAGGKELGDAKEAITAYLQSHALPGIVVSVRGYDRFEFELDVTIQVRTEAFDPEKVRLNVRDALLRAFSARERRIGAPLYLSGIYAVVENVKGVERSVCCIKGVYNPIGFIMPHITLPGGMAIRRLRRRLNLMPMDYKEQLVIFPESGNGLICLDESGKGLVVTPEEYLA